MPTVFITGANRGLGLEMVRQYSQEGWQVIACCRNPSEAETLHNLAHHNEKVQIYALDVSDESAVYRLSQQLKSQTIDILINNAGVYVENANFGLVASDSWLQALRINTIAPLLIAQAFCEQIANSQLKILANISSAMGSIGLNTRGGSYIYRSSKAALNAVSRTLSIDLQPKNIIVIAFHPGWVQTDMGGEDAPLTPSQSISGIRRVLSAVSMKDSGSFLDYLGQSVPF